MQNSPNPFNPKTEIRFRLDAVGSAPTALKVYDTTGRLVRNLVDDSLSAGEYRVFWDGADEHGQPVSSGVYFYRLTSGDEVETRKMILLK